MNNYHHPVAKTRRINNRWIVHYNLRSNTNHWLDHLEKEDPNRLHQSCLLALRAANEGRSPLTEDPKPLFYSALFALATPGERKRFLTEHHFTRRILEHLHGTSDTATSFSSQTDQLARKIADVVSGIVKNP
ncbi:MAG: hypothetical protein QM627_13845 [Luteolibacter sp.]